LLRAKTYLGDVVALKRMFVKIHLKYYNQEWLQATLKGMLPESVG
jgi:hypothetical protein